MARNVKNNAQTLKNAALSRMDVSPDQYMTPRQKLIREKKKRIASLSRKANRN